MSMFSNIYVDINCPKCKQKFKAHEQVKWTNECLCKNYYLGDIIDAEDGAYIWATGVRPYLISFCPRCRSMVQFAVLVKNGILTNAKVINFKDKDCWHWRRSIEEVLNENKL